MNFVYRALQTLFIVYENTFEIKNGKGHYKLSFETKNIKIGSVWGALGAKNCSKMGRNWAEICLQCSTGFVYCLWKNFAGKLEFCTNKSMTIHVFFCKKIPFLAYMTNTNLIFKWYVVKALMVGKTSGPNCRKRQ